MLWRIKKGWLMPQQPQTADRRHHHHQPEALHTQVIYLQPTLLSPQTLSLFPLSLALGSQYSKDYVNVRSCSEWECGAFGAVFSGLSSVEATFLKVEEIRRNDVDFKKWYIPYTRGRAGDRSYSPRTKDEDTTIDPPLSLVPYYHHTIPTIPT